MYKVEKKNRILRIPDEKFDEYKKMGYIIRDENDNILFEPENIKATAEKLKKENEELKAKLTEATLYAEDADKKIADLQKENEELKAKLTEATLYAEDADKKIADLQKENEELKAAIQAQATMGAVAPTSEDSEKKPAAKGSKKTE